MVAGGATARRASKGHLAGAAGFFFGSANRLRKLPGVVHNTRQLTQPVRPSLLLSITA
jgi:hypothetical protein